jgi:RNA polymerase sigma factor (sigma-70 family)
VSFPVSGLRFPVLLEPVLTNGCSQRAFCAVSSPPFNLDRWFNEEVLPHEPALRAWLRTRYPMLPDIDDLVQESYSRVLRARAAAPIGAAKGFLFATARNLAFDYFRRKRIVDVDSLAEIEELSVWEDKPDVFEIVSRQQELELLTQAIQSLPARCRQVLTLRKIYGLSQKQIASELGISEHTVEAQVGNGVRRCAEFLARHGLP